MKKRMRIAVLLLALMMAWTACAALADDYDAQDEYWKNSGREYLWNALWNGGGRKLSDEERSIFFQTQAVTMTQVLMSGSGFFAINGDGSYTGRFAQQDYDGTIYSADFYGRFTEVVQLNMYTYALRTDQINFTKEEIPEVMQETMLFTVPGERKDLPGALAYEISSIAKACGLNENNPLPCAFIVAFDSSPTWYSALAGGQAVQPTAAPTATPKTSGDLYGLTIDKLATRKGPGTQYDGGGTYSVKGQYIKVLSRAWDKRNGIWWVKCEIPYRKQIRVLWTGYKRFDPSTLPLESIPLDDDY